MQTPSYEVGEASVARQHGQVWKRVIMEFDRFPSLELKEGDFGDIKTDVQ